MILKAEKLYGLPSVSWRPREAGGVAVVLIWMAENRSVCGGIYSSLKA